MEKITVAVTIAAPIEKVWQAYNNPADIIQWNAVSPDWHCPRAEVDLKVGGQFSFRMEEKDNKQGFDWSGTYTKIIPQQLIEYEFEGRHCAVNFVQKGAEVVVTVAFDAETINDHEKQRAGWQSILDSFKKYLLKQ